MELDLRTLPKVELHVHFGGNLSEAVAAQLARRHGVRLGDVVALVDGRYPAGYGNFGGFLRELIALNDLVRTPDDVETAAAAIALGQAEQGIVYTELIVTVLSHTARGLAPGDFWAALRSGLTAGGAGTRINVIVDAIRDDGPEALAATLRAIDAADAPIVAVALTGVEDAWPTEDFAFIRDAADERGLRVEVHAGEMGPPAGIVAALDVLGADRIGHGVAAIHDPDVLARLVRDQVPLEVCPTSNIQIGLFESWDAHPVRAFWERGVNMTISSDDPPLMGTTLTEELRRTAEVAQLTRHDLAELQRRAARCAFLPEAERAALVARVDAWADESA